MYIINNIEIEDCSFEEEILYSSAQMGILASNFFTLTNGVSAKIKNCDFQSFESSLCEMEAYVDFDKIAVGIKQLEGSLTVEDSVITNSLAFRGIRGLNYFNRRSH